MYVCATYMYVCICIYSKSKYFHLTPRITLSKSIFISLIIPVLNVLEASASFFCRFSFRYLNIKKRPAFCLSYWYNMLKSLLDENFKSMILAKKYLAHPKFNEMFNDHSVNKMLKKQDFFLQYKLFKNWLKLSFFTYIFPHIEM